MSLHWMRGIAQSNAVGGVRLGHDFRPATYLRCPSDGARGSLRQAFNLGMAAEKTAQLAVGRPLSCAASWR